MDLRGKRVVVVGLGRSGRAAAQLCLDQGARVTLTDQREPDQLLPSLGDLAQRCDLALGEHPGEIFTSAGLVVVSPGVPPLAQLEAARAAGVPVIGEVELAFRFVRAPIIGVTGTNGKSTTTQLIGDMLSASGRPVFCGGNLGQPLSEAVQQDATGPAGVVVVELSSFQLETVECFKAHVAVLLNLSEDHLDRYPDYAAYKRAKARLFERQSADDFAVISGEADQSDARRLAQDTPAAQLTFRCERDTASNGWQEGDALCVRLPAAAGRVERYPRNALRVPGRHNTLNALAALSAARLAGASVEDCQRALRAFVGLPHRMQLVGEHAGVRYYDDSKATNVGAVVGSLAGFEQPVVLIAGGTDKGGDYAPLARVLRQVCRHVILIGAAADRIQAALDGTAPVHRASTLPQAVRMGSALAQPGDAVVLSPACSSFDMFRNFEQRGHVFAEAVAAIRAVS